MSDYAADKILTGYDRKIRRLWRRLGRVRQNRGTHPPLREVLRGTQYVIEVYPRMSRTYPLVSGSAHVVVGLLHDRQEILLDAVARVDLATSPGDAAPPALACAVYREATETWLVYDCGATELHREADAYVRHLIDLCEPTLKTTRIETGDIK